MPKLLSKDEKKVIIVDASLEFSDNKKKLRTKSSFLEVELYNNPKQVAL